MSSLHLVRKSVLAAAMLALVLGMASTAIAASSIENAPRVSAHPDVQAKRANGKHQPRDLDGALIFYDGKPGRGHFKYLTPDPKTGLSTEEISYALAHPYRAQNATGEPVLVVTGITTGWKEDTRLSLVAISKIIGRPVVLVNNASSGMILDVLQTATDRVGAFLEWRGLKLTNRRNQSVASLDAVIQHLARKGIRPEVLAHSQGAAILANTTWRSARALADAGVALQKLHPLAVTAGGAGRRFHPDFGEQHHLVNTSDPVPNSLGPGITQLLAPAPGAKGVQVEVHFFNGTPETGLRPTRPPSLLTRLLHPLKYTSFAAHDFRTRYVGFLKQNPELNQRIFNGGIAARNVSSARK